MEPFPARRSSDSDGSQPLGQLTALIVLADASDRNRIALLARRAGFVADEASEKQGALSQLEHATYDLLIAGRDVAGLDLRELIAGLRAGDWTRNVYAVVAAPSESGRDVDALSAGFDGCLGTPTTDVEITLHIVAARRQALRQRALNRAVAELYGLAARDELTGVFNRRFFLFEAEKLLRKRTPLTIVLFDLDGFKRINDTHGHLTGDRVLRDVGAFFQRSTRPGDLLARFGDDEFVMAVEGQGRADAERVARRLVKEIGKLRWTAGAEEFSVGVTIGFGSSESLDDPLLERLLEAADRDLDRNKQGRRDEPAPPSPSALPEA